MRLQDSPWLGLKLPPVSNSGAGQDGLPTLNWLSQPRGQVQAAIAGLIPTLKNLSYKIGMVVAEGDLVMVHGRYVGWGPKPLVAVDIFKVIDGKVVEHWDVMQEEVPVDKTASGNPMFSQA